MGNNASGMDCCGLVAQPSDEQGMHVLKSPRENSESVQKVQRERKMLPFSYYMPTKLNNNDKITFTGKIADDAESFLFDLVCDHEPVDDPDNIAYRHMAIFNDSKSIVNHKINGEWQEEQEVNDGASMLIEPGQEFTISLIIIDGEIWVSESGNHHSKYETSISCEDIKYLHIRQGIERIDSISVEFNAAS